MIERYVLPEMGAVWADEARLGHWLEIEILVAEALAGLGVVPDADAREIRAKASFDAERVAEVERVTKHDVAAFVQVVAGLGRTGGALGALRPDLLRRAGHGARAAAARRVRPPARTARAAARRSPSAWRSRNRDVVMAGRTHGVVAEPTSFGHKVALWAFELDRDRDRLRRARETVSVGAISGAVGTYAQVDPRVEEEVCAKLGLRAAEASSQIVARDRHAELMAALAITASTLDAIATEIRHLARTEVREVQEPFTTGQKGSSAMPHKRNPVRCERVTGLARVIRGNLQAALENTVLWHERDISHSSAERVILPDSTIALHFMLAEMTEVLDGLVIHPERMRENLQVGGGSGLLAERAAGARGRGAAARRGLRDRPGAPRLRRGTRARRSGSWSPRIPACANGSATGSTSCSTPRRRCGTSTSCSTAWRRSRSARDERHRGPAPRTGQGPRHLRRRRRPGAARRDRPHQRVRRGPAQPDPGQGPRPDGAHAVLARTHDRRRPQPPRERRPARLPRAVPQRAGARRPRDARHQGAGDPRRVRGARLPHGFGAQAVPGRGSRLRRRAAGGAGRVVEAPRADLHARRRRPPRATTCRSRSTRRSTWSAAGSPNACARSRSPCTSAAPRSRPNAGSCSPTRSSSSGSRAAS